LGNLPLVYLYAPKIMIKRLLWMGLIVAIALSCLEEPDCVNLKNGYIGLSFRRLFAINDTTLSSKDTTLVLSAINANNVPFNAGANAVKGIRIPLDYTADSTLISFETGGKKYQAVFRYQIQPQFISGDCGSRFVFGDLNVPKELSSFDSVNVINRTPVDTLATSVVHVHLFIR
jgi:hypothetical protein